MGRFSRIQLPEVCSTRDSTSCPGSPYTSTARNVSRCMPHHALAAAQSIPQRLRRPPDVRHSCATAKLGPAMLLETSFEGLARGRWTLRYGGSFRSTKDSSYSSAPRHSTSLTIRTLERPTRTTVRRHQRDRRALLVELRRHWPVAWAGSILCTKWVARARCSLRCNSCF